MKKIILLFCGLILFISCSTSTDSNKKTTTQIPENKYYSVTILNGITNGTITTTKTNFSSGELVNIFITPYGKAQLGKIEVKTIDDIPLTLTGNKNTKTFIMPKTDVTIFATFNLPPSSPIHLLQEGFNGTAGTFSRYITFGSWPQTLKSDQVLIDEEESIDVGFYTYYKGSDNEWYSKKLIDYSTNYAYLKVEPIRWRILCSDFDHDNNSSTTGKKLLLAEICLDTCMFYDYESVNRKISNETIYPSNYQHSRIRAYLNGISYVIKLSNTSEQTANNEFMYKGFLQTAFSEDEQKKILTTKVINNIQSFLPVNYTSLDSSVQNGWWNSGNNPYIDNSYLNDKIFLLSNYEFTTFFGGFQENGDHTPAIRNNLSVYYNNGIPYQPKNQPNFAMPWWLRSPDFNKNYVINCVAKNGTAYSNPENWVTATVIEVVPALCID